MIKKIYLIFDKLEDIIRGRLSHYPILYASIGGAGAVIFWRGVWHTTDYLMALLTVWRLKQSSIDLETMLWWDGPLSLLIGSVIMLATGVFVSNFIGNEIIITGLKGDKKLTEKTEKEVRVEAGAVAEIKNEVAKISSQLDRLEKEMQIADKVKI